MRATAGAGAAIPVPRGGARASAPRRRGARLLSCFIYNKLIYNLVEGGATQSPDPVQ